MSDTPKHTNRLSDETSPYLLQHAHNPVDWYPWSEEALERAKGEDKPILLSIGYSACHWCHVMERESFENEEIAAIMNRHFVNIKVDREERPDLDEIYMNAVQIMTRQGGWPMTMFLTPDLQPFYGGTYFPPDDRYGRPGFANVLQAVATAYRDRRDDVTKQADQIVEHLTQLSSVSDHGHELTTDLLGWRLSTLSFHLRFPIRRIWKRAQVSTEHGIAFFAALLAADGQLKCAGDGGINPGEDGARRNVRSTRRRISPLFNRCRVARPALREDALR